ncbi:MAG: T9SS type A sorting domain-containing protein, partial [Vicingaceae bacterium]
PFIDSAVYGGVFGAYYYFDDICVSSDSNDCYQNVSVNELTNINSLVSIYPNPISDYIIVQDVALNQPYNLLVYNSVGQLLFKEDNIDTEYKKIDASIFTSGLLYIQIKSKNNISNYKLIKH